MTGRRPRFWHAIVAGTAALAPGPAHAVCSVFDERPCTPTHCSVFDGEPCRPELVYPIGQELLLTIEGSSSDAPAALPSRELDTISDVFAMLRACWTPPAKEDARSGMELSVRVSFKRSGEILGAPRVTYMTREAAAQTKQAYREAMKAAFARCAPLRFSKGLGGALAGRPFAIRFVDRRSL